MDARTRFNDLHEAVSALVEAKMAELNTALPAKIVSVDFAKQTCVVQPVIKARIRKPDGSQEWVSYPQIPDVPLHFPTGGGVTMTFPVKEGDEALIHFSSRVQDAWQQQSGEQPQAEMRAHDVSNAFAMVGFKSEPRALSNVSSTSTQIRSDDGKQVLDIHPTNGFTMTSEGVSMTLTKDGVDFTGGHIKHNGKSIDASHIHGGVMAGAATTDVPAN
jgi:hypothetical protein